MDRSRLQNQDQINRIRTLMTCMERLNAPTNPA